MPANPLYPDFLQIPSFNDLIEKGFLTEAIVNYIALLGWAPKGENEIFSLEELVHEFSIDGLSKAPAIFDPVKLKAINGEYIRRMSPEEFLKHAEPYIRQAIKRPDVDMAAIAAVLQPRTEIFTDIPEQLDFIDEMPEYSNELYTHKKMKTNEQTSIEILKEVLPVLEALEEPWSEEKLHETLFGMVEKLGVKNGYLLWPVRVAVSGKAFTPGGAVEILHILGKEESLKRLKKSMAQLS